jgi:hypothetical protein
MWIYPDTQGISQEYSSREIILGWQLDFARHCKAQFGSYCAAYDEPNPTKTNTMQDGARQAICLGPHSNFQGT